MKTTNNNPIAKYVERKGTTTEKVLVETLKNICQIIGHKKKERVPNWCTRCKWYIK